MPMHSPLLWLGAIIIWAAVGEAAVVGGTVQQAASQACAVGFFCPNASAQIACGAGAFCAVTGLSAPVLCAPGYYCANGEAFTVRGAVDGQGMGDFIAESSFFIGRNVLSSVFLTALIKQSW